MKLSEHQAKTILSEYGIRTPRGKAIYSPDETAGALDSMNIKKGVIKIPADMSGRAAVGGVRFFHGVEEAVAAASDLFQPGRFSGGMPGELLLEERVETVRELYVSVFLDRKLPGTVLLVGRRGGSGIEARAAAVPENIRSIRVSTSGNVPSADLKSASQYLSPDDGDVMARVEDFLRSLLNIYMEKDCLLLEVNPLAVDGEGRLWALDCKMEIDDNALFRQAGLRDKKPPVYSFCALGGNIGCVVNGAGLAMAAVDLIHEAGGYPANFLDLGGAAREEEIEKAVTLVLGSPKLRCLLINLFGGILRCDIVARVLAEIWTSRSLGIPVVVRFKGAGAEEGVRLLKQTGRAFHIEESLTGAAEAAVRFAQKSSDDGSAGEAGQ